MKLYITRAIKQFLFYAILATVIISIMMALDATDVKTYKELFTSQQWNQMILLLAGLSAIYPIFGYSKRTINLNVVYHREDVIRVLSLNNYKLVEESENSMIFRGETLGKKLRWLFEDQIEINTTNEETTEISGPRKEVVILIFRIQTYIQHKQ